MLGAKEVNWLFKPSLSKLCLALEAEEADWDSKPSLRRLLYSSVAEDDLVLYRFRTPSAWEFLSQLRLLLVLVFLYTYQVGQASFPLAQV